eukprot:m51a1_g7318 hypothetical protein (477) ;mRNA; r:139900-142384
MDLSPSEFPVPRALLTLLVLAVPNVLATTCLWATGNAAAQWTTDITAVAPSAGYSSRRIVVTSVAVTTAPSADSGVVVAGTLTSSDPATLGQQRAFAALVLNNGKLKWTLSRPLLPNVNWATCTVRAVVAESAAWDVSGQRAVVVETLDCGGSLRSSKYWAHWVAPATGAVTTSSQAIVGRAAREVELPSVSQFAVLTTSCNTASDPCVEIFSATPAVQMVPDATIGASVGRVGKLYVPDSNGFLSGGGVGLVIVSDTAATGFSSAFLRLWSRALPNPVLIRGLQRFSVAESLATRRLAVAYSNGLNASSLTCLSTLDTMNHVWGWSNCSGVGLGIEYDGDRVVTVKNYAGANGSAVVSVYSANGSVLSSWTQANGESSAGKAPLLLSGANSRPDIVSEDTDCGDDGAGRGALLNVGFLEGEGESVWTLLHDQVELWDGVFLVGVDLARFDPCCNAQSDGIRSLALQLLHPSAGQQ